MRKMPEASLAGLRLHDAEGIHLSQKVDPTPGLSTMVGSVLDGHGGEEDQVQLYTSCAEEKQSQG